MMNTTCRTWVGGVVLLVAGAFVHGCSGPQVPAPAAPKISPIERGQYLVTITGCNDCHTPFKMGPTGPEPDMTRQLSGHPAALKMPPPP